MCYYILRHTAPFLPLLPLTFPLSRLPHPETSCTHRPLPPDYTETQSCIAFHRLVLSHHINWAGRWCCGAQAGEGLLLGLSIVVRALHYLEEPKVQVWGALTCGAPYPSVRTSFLHPSFSLIFFLLSLLSLPFPPYPPPPPLACVPLSLPLGVVKWDIKGRGVIEVCPSVCSVEAIYSAGWGQLVCMLLDPATAATTITITTTTITTTTTNNHHHHRQNATKDTA